MLAKEGQAAEIQSLGLAEPMANGGSHTLLK